MKNKESEQFIGNKKVKQKKSAFCEYVEKHKERPFYVFPHDDPDPDALASAYGMVYILQFLGVERIESYYKGEISHPQNRAMHNTLNMPIVKLTKQIESQIDNDGVFIYVDCTSNQQKNMTVSFEPHIVIDHHKIATPKNIIFIHDEVGSCSTLVTDLMLSMPDQNIGSSKLKCFDPEADGMKDILTSLAVGIKTDTLDFRNETTTEEDFKAYKLLSRYLSDDNFNKIINYSLPPYVFEYEAIAWKNKNLQPPNLITGIAYVESSRAGALSHVADHLMRHDGIQTVVVYAIIGNVVKASVRTVSASTDAKTLTDEIFGEGNGGGKHGVAGASVPFNVFNQKEMEEEDRWKLWDLVKSTIERKFFKATQK